MPEWESEIEVGEELARELIAEQFPGLALGSLHRVGESWDNTVWATGDEIAFRFPRREIAITGVEREIAMLPQIAKHVPAPVPDAACVGAAGLRFPWPWFGSRLIVGQERAFAGLDVVRRRTLAAELGEFLRCLHNLQPDGLSRPEIDPMGRADMSVRVPKAREALKQARSMCWHAVKFSYPQSRAGDPFVHHVTTVRSARCRLGSPLSDLPASHQPRDSAVPKTNDRAARLSDRIA